MNFDSRRFPLLRGKGFPSCQRALCRIPPNRYDPHGYYAEIGVRPGATEEEIRARVRQLYRRLHPDTGTDPDSARLTRVKLIANVLLDPESRDLYNQTPKGARLLDQVYMSELRIADIHIVKDVLTPSATTCTQIERPDTYDYLADDWIDGDRQLAQEWYEHLVRSAPLVGFTKRIMVRLHDGDEARWHPVESMMSIPRRFTPSTALAFALLSHIAGLRHAACRVNDLSHPRYMVM